jgi:uncharacterized protein (DUF302 family)
MNAVIYGSYVQCDGFLCLFQPHYVLPLLILPVQSKPYTPKIHCHFWRDNCAALSIEKIQGEISMSLLKPVCIRRAGFVVQPTGERAMSYCFSKQLIMGFDEAVLSVTEELKKEGFGILTEIDVTATLKEKLDVDFRKYRILGACNPPFAYRALQVEPRIGVMLPCNVIVQELDDGIIEVAAVDPLASMQAIHNKELQAVAEEIRLRLKKVIEHV